MNEKKKKQIGRKTKNKTVLDMLFNWFRVDIGLTVWLGCGQWTIPYFIHLTKKKNDYNIYNICVSKKKKKNYK